MATKRLALAAAALLSAANGMSTSGRPGYGLVGYGISMYKPLCAYSCANAIPQALSCPGHGHDDADVTGPSPECLATNEPYLRSLAWCLHSHCRHDVELSALEKWWRLNVPGKEAHQPVPSMSYQQALAEVGKPPTQVLAEGEVLNRTVLAEEDVYRNNYSQNLVFEEVEVASARYGLIVFTSACAMPVFLSLARFLPLPPKLASALKAHVVDPPLFGSRHATPVLGLATVPTRGQALFITYIVAINVVLSAVGYRVTRPSMWFPNTAHEVTSYVANRTGHLSFANMPLLILYSGRNNVLLWLTNWSYATFLLLHRWVALICTLEACLHSVLYLGLKVHVGQHDAEARLPYWYWGIIATLCLALMLPSSILPLRRVAYEVFLVAHIALAVMAIVGSWYHILYRYGHQWGYETWLYMAMAIWAFDRVLRLARIARRGVKTAHVTKIDDEYLRIDVPGVDCRGHAYLYFPTLTWRFWENHPFSVVGCNSSGAQADVAASGAEKDKKNPKVTVDAAAEDAAVMSSSSSMSARVKQQGISIYIRAHDGITSLLASKADSVPGIPVLVEASYHDHAPSPTIEYPNTLCIAGGVGISALLPALSSTLSLHGPMGTTKLYWASRSQPLVDSVEGLLRGRDMSGVEAHIAVGQRLNLDQILERELSNASRGGTTVVVCGPPTMSDQVRCLVAALGRRGHVARLVDESFSW